MSWSEAIAALRGWADGINDLILTDFEYGCEDEEGDLDCGCDADDGCDGHEVEIGRIDSADIIRAVIGRDLAAYL